MPKFLFNKVVGLRPGTLLKRRFWHSYFPVNNVKFLRTPIFIESLMWLLVTLVQKTNFSKSDALDG